MEYLLTLVGSIFTFLSHISYMTQNFLLFIIFIFCYIVLYGIKLIRDRWLIGSLTGAVVFDKVAKYIQRYLFIRNNLFLKKRY
jgi:hypothetical protein